LVVVGEDHLLEAMAAAAAAGKQVKKRQEAAAKWAEEESYLNTLMKDFDKSEDGKLDKGELADLLTQVNHGTRPTEEEIEWVFNVADNSDGKESAGGTISFTEFKVAIKSWKTYMENKATIDTVFEKYDQDKTGKLEFSDLKEMLKDLNDGVAPADHEVWSVMDKATGRPAQTPNDGEIRPTKSFDGVGRMEVLYAITVWYAQEEERQGEVTMSSCCVIS